MTFRIPSQGRVSQPNSSDVQGTIYATRNIDLDEEGYIKLSPGVIDFYNEAADADFGNVQSMFHGSNVYFVGGDLFREGTIEFNSTPQNVTATDTTPPSPGPEEDGVFFNGTEVVSDGSNVKYNASGTWTTISGTQSPAIGNPSCMAVFPAQNSLLFGTGNKVNRINSSWTVAQTLTLPADYEVTSIDVNGAYAYIATRHAENGEAVLFLWLGATTTNDGSFGVGTFEISTVRKYQSSVALVDSLGRLLQFTGSGFQELASLPVYYTRQAWASASNEYGGISNRGMVVDGDLIYLSITAEIDADNQYYIDNMPGGVWCYDPKVGLYHKYSPSNSSYVQDVGVGSGDVNTTTNVITVTGITVPSTGTPVYYSSFSGAIGGLSDDSWYYTIKVTDTTFKVANTKQEADSGTEVSLTSTGTTNYFFFLDHKDYGCTDQETRSSILVLNNTEYNQRQFGRVIFASPNPTATGTERWRLNITCPRLENQGYFVTPKMFASNPTDTFTSITLRFLPLKYGDKITVKYKTTEKTGFPIMPPSRQVATRQVTWTSATTFTTTATPDTGFYYLENLEAGDEMEVLGGASSGFISEVESVTKSGYQYTVTLKDASPFYASGDLSVVKFDNWTTLEEIDYTYEDTQKTIAVDSQAGWAQFKIIMKGNDIKVFDNLIDNKVYGRPR